MYENEISPDYISSEFKNLSSNLSDSENFKIYYVDHEVKYICYKIVFDIETVYKGSDVQFSLDK